MRFHLLNNPLMCLISKPNPKTKPSIMPPHEQELRPQISPLQDRLTISSLGIGALFEERNLVAASQASGGRCNHFNLTIDLTFSLKTAFFLSF